MESIRNHIYLIENILKYREMNDQELKDTYTIRCRQLNEYLDSLEEKKLIEKSKAKRANKNKVPEGRANLFKRLIELDTRIFTGRLLEIMKESGEEEVRLFIAGGN